jgi:hypothetical protein
MLREEARNSLLLLHSFETQCCKLIFLPQLPFSNPCCYALEIIRTSELHYLDGDAEEGGLGKIILKEIRNYLIKGKRH